MFHTLVHAIVLMCFRVVGFEPTTTCTQNRYATKLRYTLPYSSGFEPLTFSLEG